jgi:hypothetical protein
MLHSALPSQFGLLSRLDLELTDLTTTFLDLTLATTYSCLLIMSNYSIVGSFLSTGSFGGSAGFIMVVLNHLAIPIEM